MKCPKFKFCEKRQYMKFLVDEEIGGKKHSLLKWAKEKLELCFGQYPALGCQFREEAEG